jgi:L-2,4-diaminobutyrate transaminase
MLRNDDELAQWDRENFFHPSTHLAQHARGETPTRIISTASGVHIEDRDGTKLLDAFAGLYCVNAGYGRSEVADAISEQAHKLPTQFLSKPISWLITIPMSGTARRRQSRCPK